MKIDKNVKNSLIYRAANWLFIDKNKSSLFAKSKILKWTDIISHPTLSMMCLGGALICLFYEGFFTGVAALNFVNSYHIGAILAILSLLLCDKKKMVSSRPMFYMIIFMVCILLSAIMASAMGIATGMLVNGILLFSQFGLAYVVSSSYTDKKRWINIIILLSIPMLLYGICQGIFGGHTSKLWTSTSETLISVRAFGFFGSPNILGSVAMILSLVGLVCSLKECKWWYVAYTVLAIVAMGMTFSRSAWIGFVVGLVVIVLFKNWKFICLAPLILLSLIIPSVRQRLVTIFQASYMNDAGLDGRIWASNNGLAIFKTSPIFGTGPGTYGGEIAVDYSSPIYLKGMQAGYVALPYTDNQWLQLLVQGGIASIVFIFCFFISLSLNNVRQYIRRHDYIALGVVAVVLAVIVNGFMANIMEFGAVSLLAGSYLGLGNRYE